MLLRAEVALPLAQDGHVWHTAYAPQVRCSAVQWATAG